MKSVKYILSAALNLHCLLLWSQAVETMAGPLPKVNNGLVVATNGHIYASDLFGTGFNGNSISKFTLEGQSETVATGLSQPAGLAFDDKGLLYVAEFTSGEISTINEQGEIHLFASGFNQPADLVFDHLSNLYVSNHGSGSISKISPKGEVSTFVTGLNKPVGLAYHKKYLYSVNLDDGKVYRIDSLGNKSLLSTLKHLPVGFMTYANEHLFVTSTGGHRIYQISLEGETIVLSGDGRPATTNGELSRAQFTMPDGIAASPTGDTLYVSENNTHLLRRILLKTPSGLEKLHFASYSQMELSPSPANTHTRLTLQLAEGDLLSISIAYSDGRVLQQKASRYFSKGRHTLTYDTRSFQQGLYFIRVEGAQFQASAPLLVLR